MEVQQIQNNPKSSPEKKDKKEKVVSPTKYGSKKSQRKPKSSRKSGVTSTKVTNNRTHKSSGIP